MGRPSLYTEELANEICAEIASGKSIRTICSAESMPSTVTIFNWLKNNKDFLNLYEKAKEEQADALAEEMLDIADNGSNDWMETNDRDNPGWKANGEYVQRSRLRLDARKWIAAKLKPRKYGDRADLNLTGNMTVNWPIAKRALDGSV